MRQGKKERIKQKQIHDLRVRNIKIPTSSIYSNIGGSLYSMTKKCKYQAIANNMENSIINRLDKVLKAC